MTVLVPHRIIQGALFLCIAAVALVFLAVLAPPWLGLKLAPIADGGVQIAEVDPRGPSAALPRGGTLLSLAPRAPAGTPYALTATDVIEEPDMLPSYGEIRAFYARQSEILHRLGAGPLDLVAAGPSGPASYAVTPGRRPVSDLPGTFWIQLVTGAGALLIGAWVLALRPRDLASRLFALTGAAIMLSAFSAAVYSSRELAIDGTLLRALSALNIIGALGFGGAMIALFLIYPRPLVRARTLWAVPAVLVPWLAVNLAHGFSEPAYGAQLPTMLEMAGIIALIVVQWVVNRRDPRARAALRWFGLAVIVGALPFILLIIAPVLFDAVPPVQQGHAFGSFLLIYAGLALGVSRYRLFDLDAWAFRVMFYMGALFALLAVDALLILGLQLQPAASLGFSLLAVGLVYLPLRAAFWDRFVARRRVENHELFRSVVDISFASSPEARAELWTALLRHLFDPLAIEPAAGRVEAVTVEREGLDLAVPAVADSPALTLRHGGQGRRLFGSAERSLAEQIVRMMRYAEEGRTGYERGRREERLRIARDLHDDVGARLLSGLHKTDVDDTHRVLRDAISDIRTIVGGLSAEQLPLAQVVAALRHETAERLDLAGIDLDWSLPAEADEVLLDYRRYRALISMHRELISNVIRHARAGRVAAAILREDGMLVMRVSDDGIGLSPTDVPEQGRGQGVRGMRRRVAELGGTFHLAEGTPGTRIEIRLPLPQKEAAAS